ncbi:hypothetical protein BKA69DRAFT_774331 [Paraphysoderma sedebokerense]|nr:hypothetical protein BKA69DRAFT_774331 [Paraphysoderma sedebokerense]
MSVFPLPSTVSLVEMLLQIPQILPKRPTLALPVGFFRMPRSWLTTSFVMFYLIHSAACDVRNVIHAAWSLQQTMTYTRDSKFTVVSYGLISTLAFLRTICQAKRKWKLGFKIEDFWSVVATDMMLCLFHLRVIECSSIYTWISWECSIVGAALVHMITSLSHRYMVVRTPNHKFNVSCVYAVSRLLHDAMDSSVAASKLSQLHEMHDKSSGSTAFSPLNALSEKLIAESSFLLHLPNRHKPPFRFIMNEYSQSLKLIASTLSFLNDDDSRHVRFCSCTFNLMDTIHIVVATYKRLGILHGFSFELRDELIDPLLSYIGDYQMLQLFLSAISLEVISHSMSEGTGKITFWVAYTESDQIEFGWDIIDAKESRQEWSMLL